MNDIKTTDSIVCEPYFGTSSAILRAVRDINIAAPMNCAMLLLGATGTGKSLIARWIHEHSPRRTGAFMDINCAGLRGDLLKSELFGHTRGAFTGAFRDHPGLIEVADGGTLFLDEIGDMDLGTQCLLLKAVEEKLFRRVGENRPRSSDFRLISATNRSLLSGTENKTFREDLYYRINTVSIELPTLASRREDIPGLLDHILKEMGYRHLPLAADVAEDLARRPWRGNVRELRNALERAMIFAQGKQLSREHFPPEKESVRLTMPHPAKEVWNIQAFETAHILRALEHFAHNKIAAAQALGMPLSSLYRRLAKIRAANIGNGGGSMGG